LNLKEGEVWYLRGDSKVVWQQYMKKNSRRMFIVLVLAVARDKHRLIKLMALKLIPQISGGIV